MNDGEEPAPDAPGRIFTCIDECEWMVRGESEKRDEGADDQQRYIRSKCSENCENAEQQQVELIDEPTAEPVTKLTLACGADEHSKDGSAADGRSLGSRR